LTRRSIPQIIFVASVALAATAVPHAIFAATNLNFTGKYVHHTGKGGSDVDPEITLDVVQNDQTVEVTREASVGKTSNQYPLNGSEQDCVSYTGVSAKCKAQVKGKSLILESITETTDSASGALVHIRTVEQWQLSGDSKMLIIKVRVDFPDSNTGISSTGSESVEEDKYARE
jgi:type 1 fimbria pilin